MAISSNDDIADFPGPESDPKDRDVTSNVVRSHDSVAGPQGNDTPNAAPKDVADAAVPGVWVLCRKQSNGEVETVRAFDDAARARADLDLAASVSKDEFWIAVVPMIAAAPEGLNGPNGISRVQALALSWLAQGADAEVSVPLEDPVVISPRHVRGFVSVPTHEWQDMEDRGWVRDGLITPSGADKVGLVRKMSDHDVG